MVLPLIAPSGWGYDLEHRWDSALPLEVHWSGAPVGWTEDDVAVVLESARATWADTCAPVDVRFVYDPELTGPATLAFEDLAGSTFAIATSMYGSPLAVYASISSEHDWPRNGEPVGDAYPYTLRHTATLVTGALLGLGLVSATDPMQAEATMAWLEPPPASYTLATDDRLGLHALYGEPVSFSCSGLGGEPLGAACRVEVGGVPAASARWDLGDGTTATGGEVAHVYAAAGTHRVEACVDFSGCEECFSVEVHAVAPGTVTRGPTASGCTHAGSALSPVPLVLAARIRRRRRF